MRKFLTSFLSLSMLLSLVTFPFHAQNTTVYQCQLYGKISDAGQVVNKMVIDHGDHVGLLTDDAVIPTDVKVMIHETELDDLDERVKNNYHVATYKNNDIILASGFQLKVVHIPGHSDGPNVLIDVDKEIIFLVMLIQTE